MRLQEIIHTCFLRGSVRIEPDQVYLAMTRDELISLLKTAERDGYRLGSDVGYSEGYRDGEYEGHRYEY